MLNCLCIDLKHDRIIVRFRKWGSLEKKNIIKKTSKCSIDIEVILLKAKYTSSIGSMSIVYDYFQGYHNIYQN